MKLTHYIMILLGILLGCAPVEDDIFTTAQVTVTAGSEIGISRVQAQARLTNINTRQAVTTSNFEGATVAVEVVRGAYQIDVEGVATCQMPDGTTRARQFRCQTDYVELIRSDLSETTLNIIFLD